VREDRTCDGVIVDDVDVEPGQLVRDPRGVHQLGRGSGGRAETLRWFVERRDQCRIGPIVPRGQEGDGVSPGRETVGERAHHLLDAAIAVRRNLEPWRGDERDT